jgi:chromosome segregation ATPase
MKFLPSCAELRHDLANSRTEIRRLQMELERRDRRISNLIEGKRDNEKRIAKIRQAAFGIVDWGIDIE